MNKKVTILTGKREIGEFECTSLYFRKTRGYDSNVAVFVNDETEAKLEVFHVNKNAAEAVFKESQETGKSFNVQKIVDLGMALNTDYIKLID